MRGNLPMTLNKSTLSEQIYQILRSDILNRKIPMGEKLTLKNLQTRFEVSSTPIREALTRLTEDGLVNYYSNVGVNVISLSKKDLTELYQFMGDLDRLAILYSEAFPKRELICRELDTTISQTSVIEKKELLLPEEISRWIEYSDRFHLLFYDYCSNTRLTHAAEKLRSQLTIFSNLYETKLQPQKEINRMHTDIYHAYCEGRIREAADLMKTHLEHSMEYALEQL